METTGATPSTAATQGGGSAAVAGGGRDKTRQIGGDNDAARAVRSGLTDSDGGWFGQMEIKNRCTWATYLGECI